MWRRFLAETTGGDDALVEYLQRLTGYCLSGLTTSRSSFSSGGPAGTVRVSS